MPLPDYLPGRFALARGASGDYVALEHFHYLPQRPATYADVWVITYADPHDPRREAQQREAQQRGAPQRGAGDRARVVAVAVLSFPTLRSAPRERTLHLRGAAPRQRAAFINAHVRTISRVVVHPQFRGLGLASALVRALVGACPTRYVEASAVMARVHPFFASAGMRRVEDERHAHDDDAARNPAYFIFDKGEARSCAR